MIDPTINDYLNGKIYKLVSNQTNDIYIGSTKNTLTERFENHQYDYNVDTPKRRYRKAFEILKYDDVRIELIEDYPTSSKFFLELREGRWILDTYCVNDLVPRNKYQHLDPDQIIDPTMNDYLKGKIYKLTSAYTSDIYIGSTKATLGRRLAYHKNDNRTTASQILQYDDVRIELLEAYPTTSQYLLELKEREWIENTKCVNKIIPTRSKQEYRDGHKTETKEYNEQYRENNKEKISKQKKQYRDEHKIEAKEYNEQYREDNKEKILKKQKQYRGANKDKIKKYRDDRKPERQEHKIEAALYNKQYREDNKAKIAKQRKQYRENKKIELKNKQMQPDN